MEFNFTNDEIIFTHKHFTDYLDLIQNKVLKELKFNEGQLELTYKLYGNDADFNKEEYDLQLRLVKEEMPKIINERIEFITKIRDKFSSAYDVILDADTLFVDDIQNKYFGDPTSITDLIKQIKNKENGRYED